MYSEKEHGELYPLLTVDLGHLRENVRVLKRLCGEHGIRITGITKCFTGDPEIARIFLEEGLGILGDSRVDNLERLKDLECEKWLIRPPMLSEISRLVRFADVSLNSEITVIRAISEEAVRQGRTHKVVLMADLGDIREGYIDYDELKRAAVETEKLPNVEVGGVGVNLTCFSFIQHDTEKLSQLTAIADDVSGAIGRRVGIVSGGNSAALDLMLRGGIPEGVNNLRLGESLLFGKERARYQYLPGTHRDVFTLQCEIVELKEKPSLPWGTVGVDSYGRRPEFTDRGPKRLKAVCALGKQDFDPETTVPADPKMILLGASSDHLMLDLTDAEGEYHVGDPVTLQLGYFSTMRAFTSDYVKKVYKDQ